MKSAKTLQKLSAAEHFTHLIKTIQNSKKIILSTHKQCDGDGLGAELALYHALKKTNKNVRVINVDSTPKKYRFLAPDQHIFYEENLPLDFDYSSELVLVFDTNDQRLLGDLYKKFTDTGALIIFIDHHPVLKMGPAPTAESWIDTSAASTGEMAYKIIKQLEIPFDQNMAQAIYTSITFDTQIFRYIRNSAVSHQIAAEMLTHSIDPHLVHRHLFGEQTVEKIKFLAHSLGQIKYFSQGRLALLKLRSEDIKKHQLDPEDARDVIDFLMNIETLEAAALFREDGPGLYKLSLRSKGRLEILSLAEKFGGGGHIYAAGSTLKGSYDKFESEILHELEDLLKKQNL